MIFVEDHWEHYESRGWSCTCCDDDAGTPFLLLSGPEPDLQWERFIAALIGLDRPAQRPAHRRAQRHPDGGAAHPARPGSPRTRPGGADHRLRALAAARPGPRQRRPPAGVPPRPAGPRRARASPCTCRTTSRRPNIPAAAELLLTSVSRTTGLLLPTERLRAAAEAVRVDIDRQVAQTDEARSLVQALEEQYDAFTRGRRGTTCSPTGPGRCPRPTNSAPSWNGSSPSRADHGATPNPTERDSEPRPEAGQRRVPGASRAATAGAPASGRLGTCAWRPGTSTRSRPGSPGCWRGSPTPGPTWSACRRRSARRGVPGRRGRRAGLHGGEPRRRPVERGGDPVPGRARRRRGRASPTSPAFPHRRRGRSPPPAPGCGSGRCTCRTGAPRTRRTTTYKLAWLRGAARRARRANCARDRRWWSAATSTSPRPTPTCGTRRSSSAPPTSRPAERQALADLRALGLADVVPTPDEGPAPVHLLGLPGRDVPPEQGHADRPGVRDASRSPPRSGRRTSTARPARARVPPTTPRSSSTPTTTPARPPCRSARPPSGRRPRRVAVGWSHGSREDQRDRGSARGAGEELERRFAARPGAVDKAPGSSVSSCSARSPASPATSSTRSGRARRRTRRGRTGRRGARPFRRGRPGRTAPPVATGATLLEFEVVQESRPAGRATPPGDHPSVSRSRASTNEANATMLSV